MTPRLIALARVVRTHGLRGEVKILPLGSAPLGQLGECYLWDPASGDRQPCRIEKCRPLGPAAIVALAGYRSITEAETLVGRLLAVPEEAALPLPRGTYYASTLVGARVETEDGVEVGEFVGLEETPGHDLWVVKAGGREHLIPAVAEIVRRVDVGARRITIRPPAGLLELSQ